MYADHALLGKLHYMHAVVRWKVRTHVRMKSQRGR